MRSYGHRKLWVVYPNRPLEYERLANRVAPLSVHYRDTPMGVNRVGMCGRYIIVSKGAGPPRDGAPVAASFDGGGSTTNSDWRTAVETAQRRAVKEYKAPIEAERLAREAREKMAGMRRSKKARSQRVRTARRRNRAKGHRKKG